MPVVRTRRLSPAARVRAASLKQIDMEIRRQYVEMLVLAEDLGLLNARAFLRPGPLPDDALRTPLTASAHSDDSKFRAIGSA